MQKCRSCLIIIASSIIGMGSKNGVLGGDKQKIIMIIWGGASQPQPITILLLCTENSIKPRSFPFMRMRTANSHFSALFTVCAHDEYHYRHPNSTYPTYFTSTTG